MSDTDVRYRTSIANEQQLYQFSLLKNNCAVYFISASAASIIEIVLKISLSNADVEDRKIEILMTSLPWTLK